MTLLAPSRLWLLLLVAGLLLGYVAVSWRRRHDAVRFTDVSLLASVMPRRPQWYRRHVPAALLLLGLAALVVSLARPARAEQVPKERATIMLAIDVSNSMAATDVTPTRLLAAEQGALAFVNQLPPRLQLGLVAFSGTAQVLVPPTTDRQQVRDAIHTLQLGPGTAIGDAIFASLSSIQSSAHTDDGQTGPPPARIVLLSDGETTRGRPNDEAAQAAQAAHVPISTIAYGTQDGTVTIQGQEVPVPVDEDALRLIAQQTGGAYYRATSGDELRDVYQGLGSSIGYDTRIREIARAFTGIGLALLVAAGGLGLWWQSRLP